MPMLMESIRKRARYLHCIVSYEPAIAHMNIDDDVRHLSVRAMV